MSRSTRSSVKRLAPCAALAAALAAGAVVLTVASTALGASQRQQAAAIALTQTCSPQRVQAGGTIDIDAVVANTGDVAFTSVAIGADAGTPLDSGDDFTPQLEGGDTNGNTLLDPGERWTYTGSFKAGDEDLTSVVDADATAPGDISADDLAECDVDIAQIPRPGVIVGVRAVSGKVMFRRPGESKFTELERVTEITVGSQVDTTRGVVRLSAGLGGGKVNSSQFSEGLFTILQKRARNAFTTLRLDGGNFRNCGRRSLSALGTDARRKRPVRRLWGNGKGRFTSRGRYSAATVRGTKWLVLDRCDGTLTRVTRGVVLVRDFRARKSVRVRAGRSYLVKAPDA